MTPATPHPTLDDAAIARIGQGLVTRTLPKAEWTHAAHFAAALWLIDHPAIDAAAEMPDLIRAYNAATGGVNSDTEGYHETITIASLAAARTARDGTSGAPLSNVLAALLAGPCGRSDWLLAHWRRETLFAPTARRKWVAPDLAPLPFPVAVRSNVA